MQRNGTLPSGHELPQVNDAPPSPGFAQHTSPGAHVVEPHVTPPSPLVVVSLPDVVSPPTDVSVFELESLLPSTPFVSPPLDVSPPAPVSVAVPPVSVLPPHPRTTAQKRLAKRDVRSDMVDLQRGIAPRSEQKNDAAYRDAMLHARTRAAFISASVAGPMTAESPVLVGRTLSLSDLADVARSRRRVALDDESRLRVRSARAAIDSLAAGGDAAPNVYGVNTGFGALSETRIGAADIRKLQRNLIRSHACAVGPALPTAAVRAMLLLRAQVLAKGHSGVREELIDRLCAMLDAGVHPRVPSQGSVGASGDLAPLAHLALVLIGEGEAQIDDGPFVPSRQALEKAGIAPVELEAKEGLALINGTQLMAAIGSLALLDAERLATVADVAGAMSLEALLGSRRPFDDRLMRVRRHPGQAVAASNLRTVLGPSEIERSHENCHKVQDAYSLRCMPQVHGATRDALSWVRSVLEIEIDAVTDNPLVLLHDLSGKPLDRAELLSGGNFHGQHLALALDLAAMAAAELANVSERRVEQLVNPHLSSGLTPFLAPKQFSGLCSGFMIAQVVAASLVSENKVLAHPSSVDSIPSSAGKEDHVSMGSIGALKLMRVVDNVTHGLAIEVLAAAAGLDQRLPLKPSSGVRAAHAFVRSTIAPLTEDRPLHSEIEWMAKTLRDGAFLRAVESEVGPLA